MTPSLTLSLLLAFAAPQAPAPPAEDAGANRRGNQVELIVDDHIVTSHQVNEQARRLLSRGVIVSSREEELELIRTSRREAVRGAIYTQAGAELGHKPEEIDARVRGLLDYYRNVEGSAEFQNYVTKANSRGRSLQATAREEILNQMWIGTVTGSFEGVGNRLWADNYIRPSRALETHIMRGRILSSSAQVQFQRLVIGADANGGPEIAREICEQLREEIAAGGDFGEQVLRYGMHDRETRGILEPEETRNLEPVLAEFGLDAAIGELTEVLPAVSNQDGKLVGYQIVKLIDRVEPPPLRPFSDPEEQANLYRAIRERTLETMIGRAEEKLQRRAYIRPPGAQGGIQPAPELP